MTQPIRHRKHVTAAADAYLDRNADGDQQEIRRGEADEKDVRHVPHATESGDADDYERIPDGAEDEGQAVDE